MTIAYETGTVPAWTMPDRLRKAREHAGLHQTELAAALGISRASISNYESGRTSPPRPTLMVWAMRCGVPLSWLEDDEPRSAVPAGDHSQSLRARRDSNPQPSDLELRSAWTVAA